MSFSTVKILCSMVLIFISTNSRSQSRQSSLEQGVSFNYGIDSQFTWLDGLRRSHIEKGSPTYTSPEELSNTALTDQNRDKGGNRTLGLSLLRLYGLWSFLNNSSLYISLRPDSLLMKQNGSTSEKKAYDSRAGVVYQEFAASKFLEEYQLKGYFSPQVYGTIGTFRYLSKPNRIYEDLLGFGLLTILPRDFFGLRLSWVMGKNPTSLEIPQTSLWSIDFNIYQGPQDRAEQQIKSKDTFDQWLGSIDPYYGFALNIKYDPKQTWSLNTLLAFHESALPHRKRSLFWEQSLKYELRTGPWQHQQVHMLRLQEDRWSHSDPKIQALQQWSYTFSSQTNLPSNNFLLLGMNLGHMEMHPEASFNDSITYTGHQFEFGFRHKIHQGFDTSILISEEHREKIALNNDVELGFQSENEKKKMIRRFAISINYKLKSS